MFKEWVTNDDKDCSIIPIKLKGYRKKQSYRNKYYFVIIVYIICCFNNKEDYFIIINFHVHLQAALGLWRLIEVWQHRYHLGGPVTTNCIARGTELLAIMKSIWTAAIPAYLRRIVYAALHTQMKTAAQPVSATYQMNSVSGGRECRSLWLIE